MTGHNGEISVVRAAKAVETGRVRNRESSAGKTFVSGSEDATIRCWRQSAPGDDDWECARVLVGHEAAVTCLEFDGRTIVSGSADASVRIWYILLD